MSKTLHFILFCFEKNKQIDFFFILINLRHSKWKTSAGEFYILFSCNHLKTTACNRKCQIILTAFKSIII